MNGWSIDPELVRKHPCWLGRIDWALAEVTQDPSVWRTEIADAVKTLTERFRNRDALGTDPQMAAGRRAYTAYGVDPKRHPSAAEALLKRVLANKPVPAINTMVDFNNLLSLSTLVPVGSYDRGRIQGDVTFQLGRAGASYVAIGGTPFNAEGFPTFVDETGPFGGSSRDSERTMVRLGPVEVTTVVMSFADPQRQGIDAIVRRLLDRASAKGLSRAADLTWIA